MFSSPTAVPQPFGHAALSAGWLCSGLAVGAALVELSRRRPHCFTHARLADVLGGIRHSHLASSTLFDFCLVAAGGFCTGHGKRGRAVACLESQLGLEFVCRPACNLFTGPPQVTTFLVLPGEGRPSLTCGGDGLPPSAAASSLRWLWLLRLVVVAVVGVAGRPSSAVCRLLPLGGAVLALSVRLAVWLSAAWLALSAGRLALHCAHRTEPSRTTRRIRTAPLVVVVGCLSAAASSPCWCWLWWWLRRPFSAALSLAAAGGGVLWPALVAFVLAGVCCWLAGLPLWRLVARYELSNGLGRLGGSPQGLLGLWAA